MKRKAIILSLILAIFLTTISLASCDANRSGQTRVAVLTYHAVLPDEIYEAGNWADNGVVQTETMLRMHMQYLYDNNFTTLTAQQVHDFLFNDYILPSRSVVLTFDDGYVDNYEIVDPILEEFGFNAILFQLTVSMARMHPDYCDAQMSDFEPNRQVRSMCPCQNARLAQNGRWDIASHSHNFHDFVYPYQRYSQNPPLQAVIDDLLYSLNFEGIYTKNGFAYPFGYWNQTALEALEYVGIEFAFTAPQNPWGYMYRDSDERNINSLLIPRFMVTSSPGDTLWYDIDFFSDVVRGRFNVTED